MFYPVSTPPCHKPQQEAKAGTENSCFTDPVNLVSFCRTSISRDRIEGMGVRGKKHFPKSGEGAAQRKEKRSQQDTARAFTGRWLIV